MFIKIFTFIFISFNLIAQPFIPGNSYFGKNNFTEYIAGSLPIIISAPHGGDLNPTTIPDRTCNNPTTVRDSYTQELIREIDSACMEIFKCHPHIIICLLDRKKIDANRDLNDGTCENPYAIEAWNDYHNFINIAKNKINADYQKGFYIDLHGHGHAIQRLELGYLFSKTELQYSDSVLNLPNYVNRSSIKNLVSTNKNNFTHSQLLRGDFSLGSILVKNNYPSVPSKTIPFPLTSEDYFSGGYNTSVHSSFSGGAIDAVQIECNYAGVRDNATSRKNFARALVLSMKEYFLKHYFIESDFNKCTGSNGIFENESHGTVLEQVYPNPTNGKFTVIFKQNSHEKTNLIIYNLLGQEVLKRNFTSTQVTLNLPQSSPQGIYFLVIRQGEKIETKKLIVSFNQH